MRDAQKTIKHHFCQRGPIRIIRIIIKNKYDIRVNYLPNFHNFFVIGTGRGTVPTVFEKFWGLHPTLIIIYRTKLFCSTSAPNLAVGLGVISLTGLTIHMSPIITSVPQAQQVS